MDKKYKKKYIQKGGVGTSGNFDTLVSNLFALVGEVVTTIVNTAEFAVNVYELPGNIGAAFSPDEYNAPGFNNP